MRTPSRLGRSVRANRHLNLESSNSLMRESRSTFVCDYISKISEESVIFMQILPSVFFFFGQFQGNYDYCCLCICILCL
jgi:hypothetical protein